MTLAPQPSAEGYFYRDYAKSDLGDYQGAIADYSMTIEINPQHSKAYVNRGSTKELVYDLEGACADWIKAASLGNKNAAGWVSKQC